MYKRQKDKLLGRYTAILAASCISHTDHNVPLVIHCAMVQPNFASPTNFFFAHFDMIIKTINPIKKARTYPLMLFASTLPTAAGAAANEVSRMNVVETGILKRVRINKLYSFN